MPGAVQLQLPYPAVVTALGNAFTARGRQLYLVGGAARDTLLRRPVKELDFTTDARPDVIKQLVRLAGAAELYAVGEKFGTIGGIFAVGDLSGGLHAEITTSRSERYQPYSR